MKQTLVFDAVMPEGEIDDVVEFWEYTIGASIETPYDNKLVEEVQTVFTDASKKWGGIPIKRVIDFGAGAGNPSIGLALSGYDITAVDIDANMVRKLKENVKRCGVKMEIVHQNYREIKSLYPQNSFDAVICMGNSIIYTASWLAYHLPEAPQVLDAIRDSLHTARYLLKNNGLILLESIGEQESKTWKEKIVVLPLRLAKGKNTYYVGSVWYIHYDVEKKARYADSYRIFFEQHGDQLIPVRKNQIRFCGYLLSPDELKSLMEDAGFRNVRSFQSRSHPAYNLYMGING